MYFVIRLVLSELIQYVFPITDISIMYYISAAEKQCLSE